MMRQMGEKLTERELEDMMKEADFNGDGKIDFDGITCIFLFIY